MVLYSIKLYFASVIYYFLVNYQIKFYIAGII